VRLPPADGVRAGGAWHDLERYASQRQAAVVNAACPSVLNASLRDTLAIEFTRVFSPRVS